MRFDLEKYGESTLEDAVRSLRPTQTVTLQGSGASLTAQPGNVRLFKLGVPQNTAKQARVPLSSMRSAKEATQLLLKSHEAILDQKKFEAALKNGENLDGYSVQKCQTCDGTGVRGQFGCSECGSRGIRRVDND